MVNPDTRGRDRALRGAVGRRGESDDGLRAEPLEGECARPPEGLPGARFRRVRSLLPPANSTNGVDSGRGAPAVGQPPRAGDEAGVPPAGFAPKFRRARLRSVRREGDVAAGRGLAEEARGRLRSDVKRFWRQIAAGKFKDVGVTDLVDGLYGGLRDRGTAVLVRARGPGVATWRLLRYWESPDGGRFRVAVRPRGRQPHPHAAQGRGARRDRPRPLAAERSRSPSARPTRPRKGARRHAPRLETAGYADQPKCSTPRRRRPPRLRRRPRAPRPYVTVPRRHVAQLRKLVTARAEPAVGGPHGPHGRRAHLMDTGALTRPAYQLGSRAAAARS